MKRIVILILLQLCWLTVIRAGEVTATAGWSLEFPKNSPPVEVININFSEKANPEGPVLDLTKGAALSKASYKLVAIKKEELEQPVEILQIIPSLQETNRATALDIVPKSLPKKDVTYLLKVDPGAWQFGAGSSYSASKLTELKLDNANLELDKAFVAPRTLQTKVEIAGGTIGTGSVQIHSGLTQFSHDALWGETFWLKLISVFSLGTRKNTSIVLSGNSRFLGLLCGTNVVRTSPVFFKEG